jgi:hypothetical protein
LDERTYTHTYKPTDIHAGRQTDEDGRTVEWTDGRRYIHIDREKDGHI